MPLADNQAREGLDDHVIGRVVCLRPGAPEAGEAAIDEVRVHCGCRLIAEAEVFQRVACIVLHEDIRALDKAAHDGLTLAGLEVQRDGPLARVLGLEIGPVERLVEFGYSADIAGHVRVVRWFDLDHIGAERGQLEGAEGTRKYMREV